MAAVRRSSPDSRRPAASPCGRASLPTEDFTMNREKSWAARTARFLSAHLDRLGDALERLRGQLREAVAEAVGAGAAGVVQDAVRAALIHLAAPVEAPGPSGLHPRRGTTRAATTRGRRATRITAPPTRRIAATTSSRTPTSRTRNRTSSRRRRRPRRRTRAPAAGVWRWPQVSGPRSGGCAAGRIASRRWRRWASARRPPWPPTPSAR